jgi:hypothetical protein
LSVAPGPQAMRSAWRSRAFYSPKRAEVARQPGGVDLRDVPPRRDGGFAPFCGEELRFGRRMKVKSVLDASPPICESSTRASVDDELKAGPRGLALPCCLPA